MVIEIIPCKKSEFAIECYTDTGDTIWISRNEEDFDEDEFCICSAVDGYIYSHPLLSNVLTYFGMNYHIAANALTTLVDYAETFLST